MAYNNTGTFGPPEQRVKAANLGKNDPHNVAGSWYDNTTGEWVSGGPQAILQGVSPSYSPLPIYNPVSPSPGGAGTPIFNPTPFNPPNPNPGVPTTASGNFDPNNPWLRTGGFAGQNFTRTPAAPASPTSPNAIYPGLTPPITGSGNIPNWPNTTGAQSSLMGDINNLLDPNNAQANYDVSMHGAERAAATGTSGSPLAAEYTGRLRQSDIERRTQLGAQLLTQQQDLALRDKFQTGQLSLQQAELALRDKIQTGQLSVEQARLILDWYRTLYPNRAGGYGGGSSGGGGGRTPTGGGGGTPTSPPYQGLPPFPDQTDTSTGVWYDNLGQPHAAQDFPAYNPPGGENFDWLSGAPSGTELDSGTAYAPTGLEGLGLDDSSWLTGLYD